MPYAPFHPYQPVTGEKLDEDNHEVLLFQAHRSVIGESCGTHAGPALRQSLLLWYIRVFTGQPSVHIHLLQLLQLPFEKRPKFASGRYEKKTNGK